MNLAFLETIEALEKELIDALEDYHESIEQDSFRLKIVEIKKDSLDLKFQYTLKQINRELEREIRKKTVRRVVNHIRQDETSREQAINKPRPSGGRFMQRKESSAEREMPLD
jgi:hypothetical protein